MLAMKNRIASLIIGIGYGIVFQRWMESRGNGLASEMIGWSAIVVGSAIAFIGNPDQNKRQPISN